MEKLSSSALNKSELFSTKRSDRYGKRQANL
ncbi:hypothetical protein P746_00463 [Enterococcus faecalis CBRD01]|nr:hypothetical protein EFD32_0492 [Enterococcus faecalis D32]ESU75382.1 hypothetical protein P746_00463 [Enterococcus faecalis CBRD01]